MSDREFDYEFSDIDAENSEHSDDRSSEQESDYEFESERRDSDRKESDRPDHRARYANDGNECFDGDVNDKLLEPTLQMCSKHKPGSMLEVCKVCSAALAMVRPEVAKQLLKHGGTQPSALARYSGRSDEKPPTLVFSEPTLELAYNTFTQGRFRGKSHFSDLVKKFLTLPVEQHEKLIQDIKLEAFFKKLESEKRFKHIFSLGRDIGDCLKNLRVSQRPIFHIISVIDGLLASIKHSGECAGLSFIEGALRDNNKVPKPLVDSLAIDSSNHLFALPDLTNMFSDITDLTSREEELLKSASGRFYKIISDYRDQVSEQFLGLFSCVTSKINEVDDFLAFYCDLYGHVDACTRDLLRSKLANCFKFEFRGEVLGKNLSREQQSSLKSTGILGGKCIRYIYPIFSFPCSL